MKKLSAFFEKSKKKSFKQNDLLQGVSEIDKKKENAIISEEAIINSLVAAEDEVNEWTVPENTDVSVQPVSSSLKIGLVDSSSLCKKEVRQTDWKVRAEENRNLPNNSTVIDEDASANTSKKPSNIFTPAVCAKEEFVSLQNSLIRRNVAPFTDRTGRKKNTDTAPNYSSESRQSKKQSNMTQNNVEVTKVEVKSIPLAFDVSKYVNLSDFKKILIEPDGDLIQQKFTNRKKLLDVMEGLS